MKYTSTLSLLIERWDDPGDYPNALAGGPLPSHNYPAGIEGELIIEQEQEGEAFPSPIEILDDLEGHVDNKDYDAAAYGITDTKIVYEIAEKWKITVTVEEIDG